MRWLFPSVCLALACTSASCSSSLTPAGPVTVTTAGPTSPANGALIANIAQPVTLSVKNAYVADRKAAVSYTFQVATDASFASIVLTKDAPQTTDQTSVKLDVLAAGKDYYWRVRTVGAGTVGEFTTPLKFTIGAAVVLQAPAVSSPANGTNAAPLRNWPQTRSVDEPESLR